MASTIIRNPSIEPTTLPFPFAGILKGGQEIKLNVAIADVVAALGGEQAASALIVQEAADGGPYDTAYQGSVGQSPLNEAALVVTGNSDLQADVAVGGELTVTSTADLQDNVAVGGDLAVAGDLAAAGGFRQTVGPFTAPGAAGVTAAGQTNLDLRYSHAVAAAALGWVAPRAGSIMGLSAQISTAVTGSAQSIAVKVTVNGTEVGAALDLAFTQAGAETSDFAVTTKGSVTFAAGDVVGVSYTSNTITNTPALVASIEVEC